MVSVENITKEFSARPILNGITFLINNRDRIALVGKNGAGKTTLLRMLAGQEEPTGGRISKDKDLNIGYLPQVMMHNEGTTLIQEVTGNREQETENQWEDESERWEEEAEQARLVAEMDRTLIGLGFERTDFDRLCSEFSGGWRMRIELAKILLSKPDLLLLDEPTNHLDIESIQWLEQWIQQAPCAVVLVSHDRAFIDNVTNRTIEISLGRIYDYNVNYSHFVELRKERHEQQVRAYENQQKMIQEAEDFIERFRYKPTKAVQVQSRIKMLDKLERLEVDQEDNSRLRLKFPPAPRSGDYPVICEEVGKGFKTPQPPIGGGDSCIVTEHVVFQHATFTIKRGEKVAFVGKNGEGKTTMVRCIMGELSDYTGTLKIGHNVRIGYFAQNQASLLDGEATVFDTIDRVAVGDIRTRIKDILGAFMFGGEASEKRVKFLSGGERSRLAMIRLLLEPVNLLILDEPTNHLDMRSKDVLKDAVREFDGTVIVVSHDREFLDGLVEKVYEFGGGQVREHLGGIYDWLRKKTPRPPVGGGDNGLDSARAIDSALRTSLRTKPQSSPKGESEGSLSYAAQKAAAAERRKKEKQIAEVEKEIERLEMLKAAIEDELNVPDNQTQENFQRYESIKHQIEQKEYEWMLLNED